MCNSTWMTYRYLELNVSHTELFICFKSCLRSLFPILVNDFFFFLTLLKLCWKHHLTLMLSCHIRNSSLGLTFIHSQYLVNSHLLFATALAWVTMSSQCCYFCGLLNRISCFHHCPPTSKRAAKVIPSKVSQINLLSCSKLCSYSSTRGLKPKSLL